MLGREPASLGVKDGEPCWEESLLPYVREGEPCWEESLPPYVRRVPWREENLPPYVYPPWYMPGTYHLVYVHPPSSRVYHAVHPASSTARHGDAALHRLPR